MPSQQRRERLKGRARTTEAIALLALGGALQRWVPMRRWSSLLGEPAAIPEGWTGLPRGTGGEPARASTERAVAQAVRHGCARLPWAPTCLAQAIACQVMLRRRGCAGVAVVGLRRVADDPASWGAHAWLIGESLTVAGGPASRGFTATTVFAVKGGLAPASLTVPQSA